MTTDAETTPLILDEVTIQCDSKRRIALLELLHGLAADRQVILFTHDEGVEAWAELSLDPERDRIQRLEVLPANGPGAPPAGLTV